MAATTGTTASPAAPAGRQFPFFEVTPVKDAHDLANSPEIFKATLEIATMASSSVGILVADIHGSIHLLNRDFLPARSWVAHVGGRVTHMVERKGILVTLGEEDAVRLPILKIWDVEHFDKKTGMPTLMRSVKVQQGNRPHPVSTIALSSTLTHLAIGLGDGTVLLYRNLDASLFTGSNSLTAIPKPKTVHESPTEPITGLGFREPRAGEDGKTENTYLFIVTTNHVLSYQVTGRGSGAAATVVDEVGAALGCAAMDHKAREIVVAREEAIYFCGPEGRGPCYAYEGPKSSIQTHRNYLIIVSPPFLPSASAASATVRNYVARAPNPTATSQMDISKVTIFEPENKFVGFSGTFKEGVREVVTGWGQVFVLTNDGKLFRLDEKPTTQKLDILFGKSLYLLAISLARTQGLEESAVADIHRRYGDHLYLKGDYDGAMQQYLKTIGHLQPSYVIRKFLDAQRIHQLTTFLQELHSRGLANSDHTTLLLNTYTKLKDVARLDSFIKTESHRPKDGDPDAKEDELPFDLETVIRVCRQAGYFEHAVYLARKYERHEDFLRIQVEDAGNYSDALAYLRKLGPEAAESNLARYGRAMLANLPEETTQLLIDLCTGNSFTPAGTRPVSPVRQPTAGASYLSYLALNRNSAIIEPEKAAPAPPAATQTVAGEQTAPSAPPHVRRPSVQRMGSVHEGSRSSTPPPKPPAPKRPSPRLYFAHFVDNPEHFVRFLEAVALARWEQRLDSSTPAPTTTPPIEDEQEKADSTAVWNTLLELYLSLSAAAKGPAADELRGKALTLLKNTHLPYDPTHALIVCSTRSFTDGLVLLWERMGMYEDVLRFWMEKEKEGVEGADDAVRPSDKVLERLNAYGPTYPHLYPLVLRFLTSTPALLSRHTADLSAILEHIDQEKIMPPLGVVQVLSRNNVASVGLVKQWLLKRIADSKEEVEADRQLIDSYRTETKTKLQEVEELSDTNNPRVFHVTRCSACGGQLDLPAIHFMCKHSYHQRCVADHETECPNCARAHGVIREIRRNNERMADQHELFLTDVEENGYSAIAAAFGRGLMGMAKLDDVPA